MITLNSQDGKPEFDDTGTLSTDLALLLKRIDIPVRHLPAGHADLILMIGHIGVDRPDICRHFATHLGLEVRS